MSNSRKPVARMAGVAPSSASEPVIGQRAKSAALARKVQRPVTSRPSSTRVSMSMVQTPRAKRVRTRPVDARSARAPSSRPGRWRHVVSSRPSSVAECQPRQDPVNSPLTSAPGVNLAMAGEFGKSVRSVAAASTSRPRSVAWLSPSPVHARRPSPSRRPGPSPTSRCFRVMARVSSGPDPRRSSNSRSRQMNRGPTKVMSAKAGAPPAAGIEMSTCRSPRAVSSASHPPGQLVGLQIGARRQREPIGALERKAHVRMDAPFGCIQLQLFHAGAARREIRAAPAQRQRGAAGFPAHDRGGARNQLASQVAGGSAGRQQVDAKALGVGPKARVAVVVDDRDVVQAQGGKGGKAAWRAPGVLRVHAAGIVDHWPFSRASVTVPFTSVTSRPSSFPRKRPKGNLTATCSAETSGAEAPRAPSRNPSICAVRVTRLNETSRHVRSSDCRVCSPDSAVDTSHHCTGGRCSTTSRPSVVATSPIRARLIQRLNRPRGGGATSCGSSSTTF